MRTKKSFFYLLATFLPIFFGCSSYIEIISQDPSPPLLPLKDTKHYCELENYQRNSIVGPHSQGVHLFYLLLRKDLHQLLPKMTFVDKAVLWALMQSNLNPAMASPTARLQLLTTDAEGKFFYADFYAHTKKEHLELVQFPLGAKYQSSKKSPPWPKSVGYSLVSKSEFVCSNFSLGVSFCAGISTMDQSSC